MIELTCQRLASAEPHTALGADAVMDAAALLRAVIQRSPAAAGAVLARQRCNGCLPMALANLGASLLLEALGGAGDQLDAEAVLDQLVMAQHEAGLDRLVTAELEQHLDGE